MRSLARKALAAVGGGEVGSLLARGGTASLVVKASGAVLGLGLHVVLARVLGADGYGDYVYALTWVGLLGLVAIAGLDTAAVRFLAAYRTRGEWRPFRGFLRRSFQLVVAFACLVALVYVAGVLLTTGRTSGQLRPVLLTAALLLPLNALLRLSGSGLQSLKHVALAEGPNLVGRPLLLGGAVLTAWALTGRVAAVDAMALNVVAAAAVLALSLALLRKRLPPEAWAADPEFRTRRWLSVGVPLAFLAALHVVIRRTDILMVGMLADTTRAGIYTVGSRMAETAGFGLTAVNMIVAPMLSEAHADGDRGRLQQAFTMGARGAAAFGVLVSLVLVVAGVYVLGVFGPEFRAAYAPMLILLGAEMAGVVVGSVGYLMTMTGHEREAAWVVGGAAVSNVALNGLMIPLWGLTGAAVATAVSMVGWNVALAVRVRRLLGVTPTCFASLGASRP